MREELSAFAADPYTRAIFTNDGVALAPGELLVQTNLGATYRQLAAGRARRLL